MTVFNPEGRRAEYLAKAKEAEALAEKAADDNMKASWRRIAASYRDLAARVVRLD